MRNPLPLLVGAIVFAATIVNAQEELSGASSASASARYWTAPRVQQDPPRAETAGAVPAGKSEAKPLVIENEFLKVTLSADANRLTISSKISGRTFITNGNFNIGGG